MIDIKVIKKPKNEGSTSALRTSGTAYGGMAVKEAAHAAKADIAELLLPTTFAICATTGFINSNFLFL